jgi:tartrate dehydrogenase/decarboxylase/D-malate dehydrogenase
MIPAFRIAAVAGDGIGKDVLPEGLRVVKAAAERFGFELEIREIEWASCDWYAQHGQMMPDDWKQQLDGFDAIYFGAVGWPATVADNVSLWDSLLKFRREFDQYINLRPVRLFDGVPCPLAGRKPGDIDYFLVRENTEGEYTNLGGVMYAGTEREVVIQESVFSRLGTDRVLRYAYDLANSRARKSLTVATKSNGIAISMPWRDGRANDVGKDYPEVKVDKQHIDIISARFAAAALRRGCREQPVRRHPVRPRPCDHRHDRPDAEREPQPRAPVPVAVRARARLGARHLRPAHRQPDRDDLVGRADARLPDAPAAPRTTRS